MAKSRVKGDRKKKGTGTAKRVFMQYFFFIWPALRTYYSIWAGYFKGKKKKAEKDKIVVIED